MAAICRRLDGLPLALELAAARLRALSPDDLAANLVEGFELLRAGGRAQVRQQSLRAAIEWSYDLLDAAQQALLRQLSVFAGGWTLPAAQAVCGATAVDGLWQLVDRSLVQVDWRDPVQPRYRLLETVRQYAAAQLEAANEALARRDEHLAYYVQLAEAAEAALDRGDQVSWLARLDAEQANLRVALGWAEAQPDAERGLQLAAALGGYWSVRGERTEGLLWLEAGLRRAPLASLAARAKGLWAAGRLAQAMRNDQATAWLEESLALSRLTGDRMAIVRALLQLGRLWLDRDHRDQALVALEEARAIAEADDNQPGIAAALELLGLAAVDQADYARGLRLLETSLDLLRGLGDRIGLVTAQRHLAMARLEMGDLLGARQPLEEALLTLEDLGDAVGLAWAEHDLARLALDSGDAAQAAALFERSLARFRRLGHTSGVAWSIHNLGRAKLALADPRQAWTLFKEGLMLFGRLGHGRGTGWRCTTWPGSRARGRTSPSLGDGGGWAALFPGSESRTGDGGVFDRGGTADARHAGCGARGGVLAWGQRYARRWRRARRGRPRAGAARRAGSATTPEPGSAFDAAWASGGRCRWSS